MHWFFAFLGLSVFVPVMAFDRVANTTLNLPGDPPANTSHRLENAFGSLTFNRPIALANAPGDNNAVYVVERGGQLVRVDLTTNTKSLFLNLEDFVTGPAPTINTSSENGFLSAAFHPDYQTNGWIFVFYSTSSNGVRQRIARVTKDPNSARVASHNLLINQLDRANNHNGGTVAFGPDRYLYVSFGDEGGANDTFDRGNHIDGDFFSCILRLDVDERPENLTPNAHPASVGNYRVPADNPFVGATSHQEQSVSPNQVRTEIWATGLRNPFRFSFDEATGDCFVADVGQNAREEINILRGGEDCGWSRREGTTAFTRGPSAPALSSNYQFHEPIHDYRHDQVGRSITGGLVYRGTRFPEFAGAYFFADFTSNRLYTLRDQKGTWTRQNLLGASGVSGFGTDPRNGDLLMTRLFANRVERLVRTTNPTEAPALLSQTGAFANVQNLTPNPGLYEYEINHPFWSDGAEKRRWFSIPNLSDTATFRNDQPWSFPAGQVWVKHFDIGQGTSRQKIETRFLVKTSQGAYGLSYRWRADGSDADLVPAAGDTRVLATGQEWIFPSRASCLSCHTPATDFALSFHTRQLNQGTQLADLAAFLDRTPGPALGLPAHPALGDEDASLESRTRAYLDVNCAMCHFGDGSVAGQFDARATTKTDLAGIINGPLSSRPDPQRLFAPGSPANSHILARLTGTGAGRMPPLASNVVDQDAVDLLTAWINQDLPGRQSYAQWSQQHFGTPDADPTADPDRDGQNNRLEFLARTNPRNPNPNSHPLTFQNTTSVQNPTSIQVTAPANRLLLIESSPDLQTWTPFARFHFPATTTPTTLTSPNAPTLFFRTALDDQ